MRFVRAWSLSWSEWIINKNQCHHQTYGTHPGNMLARLATSAASAMSSFTAHCTLSDLSNLRDTELSALSAASSAVPLLMSIPIPNPSRLAAPPSLVGGTAAPPVGVSGCTCFNLISLAVLFIYKHKHPFLGKNKPRAHHECRGSCLNTSRIVRTTSELFLSTRSVSSAQR